MGYKMERAEGGVRLLCLALTLLAALILRFNKQKKHIVSELYVTATVKDLRSNWALMVASAVASGYQFLQLLRCLLPDEGSAAKWKAWACFLMDQGVMYTLMAVTAAVLQASSLAMNGLKQLQWMKLCDMYGAYCRLNGVAVFCAVSAAVTTALLSTISAHHLFRLYATAAKPTSACSPSSLHDDQQNQ